eukprot:TRINITY_DN3619_c0_g2_i1.p1 TRINITY_DN3619_c0_g2~~TRINITY_DN3619_c0_g2_i1.p1  ORF type:complete len:617 (+),score=163.88 TRINITY_DN3619_c0_g2_i1:96-1946(+)
MAAQSPHEDNGDFSLGLTGPGSDEGPDLRYDCRDRLLPTSVDFELFALGPQSADCGDSASFSQMLRRELVSSRPGMRRVLRFDAEPSYGRAEPVPSQSHVMADEVPFRSFSDSPPSPDASAWEQSAALRARPGTGGPLPMALRQRRISRDGNAATGGKLPVPPSSPPEINSPLRTPQRGPGQPPAAAAAMLAGEGLRSPAPFPSPAPAPSRVPMSPMPLRPPACMPSPAGMSHSSPIPNSPGVHQSAPFEALVRPRNRRAQPRRCISTSAYKILDAPGVLDDFYLHLLHWGAKNLVAVALGQSVYIWNAKTAKVTRLCYFPQGHNVTAVRFNTDGTRLAVGLDAGIIHTFDPIAETHVGSAVRHTQRVCSLAFRGDVMTSGAADHRICMTDMRIHDRSIESLCRHTHEVCGLEWSPCENYLLSGGNDNLALVWSAARSHRPLFEHSHSAAVKALAWSPHQSGLFATGGGSADRTIQFHSTLNGTTLFRVVTPAQICDMLWATTCDEILTCHGYAVPGAPPAAPTQQGDPVPTLTPRVDSCHNSVCLWRFGGQSLRHLSSLQGHSQRVLHITLSPDGTRAASGAPDETIRFWNCFPPATQPRRVREHLGLEEMCTLR